MGKKERGNYDYCTDTKNVVSVTAWNDNRVVLTVSTCNALNPIGQATRWISSEKKSYQSLSHILFLCTTNTWVEWTGWTKTLIDIGFL